MRDARHWLLASVLFATPLVGFSDTNESENLELPPEESGEEVLPPASDHTSEKKSSAHGIGSTEKNNEGKAHANESHGTEASEAHGEESETHGEEVVTDEVAESKFVEGDASVVEKGSKSGLYWFGGVVLVLLIIIFVFL